MKYLIVAILLSVGAQAQICPVQLAEAAQSFNVVVLRYTNQSEQEISAVSFVVQYFNAVDNPTISLPYVVQRKLKAHKYEAAILPAFPSTGKTKIIAAVDRIK